MLITVFAALFVLSPHTPARERLLLWLQSLQRASFQRTHPEGLQGTGRNSTSSVDVEGSTSSVCFPVHSRPPGRSPIRHAPLCINVPRPTKRLNFLMMDYHAGSQVITQSMLRALGQRVDVQSLSSYCQHHKFCCAHASCELLKRISSGPNARLPSRNAIRALHQQLNTMPQFQRADVLVCSFPPAMCQMFATWGKKLLVAAYHRFHLGRTNVKLHLQLVAQMQQWAKKPCRNVTAALSPYESEYTQHFTGIRSAPTYAHALPYLVREWRLPYRPVSPKTILVGPAHVRTYLGDRLSQLMNDMRQSAASIGLDRTFCSVKLCFQPQPAFKQKRWFKFAVLTRVGAVVMLPYNAYSTSAIELLAMGLPAFVPSPRFLHALGIVTDRTLQPSYCTANASQALDATNLQVPHGGHHPHSPNTPDTPAFLHWMQWAHFYGLWGDDCIQFDSFEDLVWKLNTTNLTAYSERMKTASLRLLVTATAEWKAVVEQLAADCPVSGAFG